MCYRHGWGRMSLIEEERNGRVGGLAEVLETKRGRSESERGNHYSSL